MSVQLTIEQRRQRLDAGIMERAAESRLRAINTRGARELLRVARRVVHVRTGRLRDGLIVTGPYNVATGAVESTVSAPSVPYAKYEIERGGDHDFVARTYEEGAGVFQAIAQDMEDALIAVMREGGL